MGEAKGDNTPLGRGLLDWLIELIKADYPDDWVRVCHLARIIERDASDDEAARRRLRVYRRYDSRGSLPAWGVKSPRVTSFARSLSSILPMFSVITRGSGGPRALSKRGG
jgi:hypothetical protein